MACKRSAHDMVGTTTASWDQEVTEVDVLTIVNTFKLADLDDVYTLLGLEEIDTENAKLRDIHRPEKQAKNILNLWRNRNGKEAKRSTFIKAVEKCPDCKACLDKLKTKWNISPSESARMKSKETHPVSNEPDERPFLETCQKKLKEIYKDRRGGIGFLPGFPKEFSSDEFFVDLQLLKEQKTPTKVKYILLETYTDLLKIQDSKGKCLDHVIVLGLAGTGKTTLVSRLAYQWADINKDNTSQPSGTTKQQSPHPLSRFQLVFTLDIRKFKPDLDLVDAIQDQLLQHISKQALESYLVANADKCLFLFDGYDELGLDEIVLNSNLLCGAHVILTTRPEKVEDFYAKHQESRYVRVQLKGFSKKNAAQFVERFFEQSRDQGNEATSLLKAINSKSFLKSFSQFPLLLAMMCLLWNDKRCLPTAMTSLYHLLIGYLARQLKTKLPTYDSTYAGCKQLLIKLGKTGFEGLMDKNSNLIFSEDEFDSKDIVENGYMLGLLTKNSRVSGLDTVTDISFIHKTFQEFCAAVYLCSVGEGNSQQLNSYLSQMNIYDMENMLRFCCGENAGNVVEDVLKHVVNVLCELKQQKEKKGVPFGIWDLPDPWKLPLTLLFETESQFGFTESLHNLFEPLVSHITFINNNAIIPGDVLQRYISSDVLEHFISESKTQNNWLTFVRAATVYIIGKDDVSMHFLKMAHIMPNLSTLTIASIWRCDCSHVINTIQSKMVGTLPRILDFDKCTCDTAVLLTLLVTQPNLTILSIPFSGPQEPTDIEALGQVLDELDARSGSMKKLSVRECDMSRFIPNIRASWNTLERLELISTHMAMDNWRELFESIIDAGQANQRKTNQEDKCDNDVSNSSIAALPLKYLDLGRSHIGDSSFNLVDAIKYISSLEYLGLNSNILDENHFSVIGPALKHFPNLIGFDMQDNRIGNSFEAITQGLNNCKLTEVDISSMELDEASNNALSSVRLPTVQKLDLCKSNITSHGAKSLSKSLPYMPMLKQIKLSHNNIGSDGAIALSFSFQYIPQLYWLDLSHNNIGSDGARALSSSFQHMPLLYLLDLDSNPIGPNGVEGIFRNLHHLPELYLLSLISLVNDSQDELSELLKACIDALPRSLPNVIQLKRDSDGNLIRDNKYWFSMNLKRPQIDPVISVIKEYNLRHT